MAVIGEWLHGKDLEESGRRLINILPQHLLEETVKGTKSLSQNIWCSGHDSNLAPNEFMSRALSLYDQLGNKTLLSWVCCQLNTARDKNFSNLIFTRD
jgi:hypothetical protein